MSDIGVDPTDTRQTILVVDDDPVQLRFMAERLQAEGYRVIAAGHGEEGLRLVEQGLPDLVILDVIMPGMSGMEVLSIIKRDRRELPVVVVTGLWDENEGRRAMELGAFDYITKPVALDYLKLAILSAMVMEDERVDQVPLVLAGENPHTKGLLRGEALKVAKFPFRVGRESRRGAARRRQRYPGSVPNNDLYLDDSEPYRVSREHFQLEYRDRQFFVRDRGSSLGLHVNGIQIGGPYPEKVQKLQKGENLIVLGGASSPFRFLVTV